MKRFPFSTTLLLFVVTLGGLFIITSCEKEKSTNNVATPTPDPLPPVIQDDDYVYTSSGEKIYYDVLDSMFAVTTHSINDSLFIRAKQAKGHLYTCINTNYTWMHINSATGEIDSMLAFLRETGEDFGYCHLLMERGSMYDFRYWPTRQIFVKTKQNVDISQLLNDTKTPYLREEQFGYDTNTHLVYLKGEKDLSLYYCNRLYETGNVDFAEPNFGQMGSSFPKQITEKQQNK